MGISTPKKPFNLAEFLAVKAKPRPMRRNFQYRSPAQTVDETPEAPAPEAEAAKD